MLPDAYTKVGLKLISTAALLIWVVILLWPSAGRAQADAAPKRVLVLYWYNKDYPGNVLFDQSFRAVLQSASAEAIEYYPEYLESNRFPGENQSLLFRDYLRQKYADLKIDVVVASGYAAQDFLLKYRNDLFSHTPLVFVGVKQPTIEELASGVTGIICYDTHRKNLDLALSLHPRTEQVFVISGTLEHDKKFETLAREQLRGTENNVQITYLTDLPPDELIATTKSLPEHSVILYVWQQSQDEQGKVLESTDVLALIARSTSAPIYGMSGRNVGSGIIGGYVFTLEGNDAKAAEIALRVANGERAQDIPVESAPTIPMFDWRELRRGEISENNLPPGSLVRFKEPTFWEHYKWHIISVLSLCAVEAFLITILLIERRRRRAKDALDQFKVELEQRVAERTAALDDKTRELETFAYSVAHDLKAPLRGIDGYSRLLLEEHMDRLDEDGRKFLYTIRASTDEMSQLIEDLLAYSRLERREMTSAPLELRPFIEALVEKKRDETRECQVDFTLNVNGCTIVTDPNGLSQALRNYLDNAVKFTCNAPEPRVEVGVGETERGCRLWVKDNGIGFDMKYHEQIFGIFERLHRDEDYEGTGVGLAIVRKAMERMGGRAWAESSPGKGATFYLEIPRSCR